MYKVFFKESVFLLTDNQNLAKEYTISLLHKDFNTTKGFISNLLSKGEKFQVAIYHDDLEDLFGIFKSCFLYVKAAGGVVCDNGSIVVIKRLGMYDLPKGHQETGESTEACAIREVEEECGLHDVEILDSLTQTFHIYYRNDCWFLKKTYWYLMSCPAGQLLIPQAEEEIEEAFRLPVKDIDTIIHETYPSLQSVFEQTKTKVFPEQ